MRLADQRFLKKAKTISLLRDARKGQLKVRFVAVSERLQVRRGTLGIDRGKGQTAKDIVLGPRAILNRFCRNPAGKVIKKLKTEDPEDGAPDHCGFCQQ